ncbi:MAG: alpha/beta hydrolase [Ignavibacteriae bacterium]|nr:MAG: alpha/beta hydrolase [Ignavibacteriota bacterium]
MRSSFVQNGSVYIHVLENGNRSSSVPPLLVIGGLWEPAERALPLLTGLKSHVAALSLRGRGLSSTPLTGYDLSHHLTDIDAVVRTHGLKDYCVLGFSRGGSYALGWALAHQRDMAGLIIVDQPPVHQKPGDGYVAYWSNLVYLGVPILNFMRLEALHGLERDAVEVDFTSRLSELSIPVALFIGRNRGATLPSDLSDEILRSYRKALPACTVVEFTSSGHMIPDEEQEKYINEVESFLTSRA